MNHLEFVYRDQSIAVVNKPSGLLSVPGRGPDNQDCVVSRLKAVHPDCIAHPTVHRLDMDTSGLLVLGLTEHSQRHLSRQFAERQVEKIYFAVLAGLVDGDAGEIELAFRLDPDNRPHQIHDPLRGKIGRTRWRKLSVRDGRTLVEFRPLTGRTHQLRLHAAHELGLGCPIVGDRLYGTGTEPGQMQLHAGVLAFAHPESGRNLRF